MKKVLIFIFAVVLLVFGGFTFKSCGGFGFGGSGTGGGGQEETQSDEDTEKEDNEEEKEDQQEEEIIEEEQKELRIKVEKGDYYIDGENKTIDDLKQILKNIDQDCIVYVEDVYGSKQAMDTINKLFEELGIEPVRE